MNYLNLFVTGMILLSILTDGFGQTLKFKNSTAAFPIDMEVPIEVEVTGGPANPVVVFAVQYGKGEFEKPQKGKKIEVQVDVSLGKELAHNLKISSASGDSRLSFNGHPIRGFIEMTAKAGRNRIKAPFKFDDEEFYYKWNDEYVTKSVTKGNARPRIEISTASGRAVLEN